MSETLSHGLTIVAGIVLACLLIALGFGIWNSNKEAANSALTDSNGAITLMEESKYTQYDGAVITGSEVINVIKQHENDDIYVGVDNGAGQVNYIYADNTLTGDGADIKAARDKRSSTYISPNTRFIGKVDRDPDTNAILGIIFTRR